MIQSKRQYVAIVLKDVILTTLVIEAESFESIIDQCWEYAERAYGFGEDYELCNILDPRHQVLFEYELACYIANNTTTGSVLWS